MQAFHHIEISNSTAGPNLFLRYPILHTTDRKRKDNIKTRSIKLTDRKQANRQLRNIKNRGNSNSRHSRG
ncbi:hypothetical protein CsSME_00012776 [Camellia sinensis var. sinensis]